ncbi:hypothetical protein BCR34DRAFT_604828 [Clohesyomyces aquaticus]|uniref:EthD domain-containing protein n=1 Tax=Clohesyomyces aquaticus TaxID=1231657 RepID=A0A1Y1Z2Q3_9PLEO|nr:hypothetical protein BCR34DRAFT_604828 [Clohesyomyces aquaticus]
MKFRFLFFITRNPSFSSAELKTHWDTKHVELLRSTMGENFPLTHSRHYIARPAETNGSWPAAVLVEVQEDFPYGGIVELVFPDEVAFQTFLGIYSAPRAAVGRRDVHRQREDEGSSIG